MSGRYLIVVPVTTNYLPECEALLRSLSVHNPDIPVHIISRNGEADHLLGLHPVVRHVHNEPECDLEFRQIRTSRFRYAADMKDQFDVVALLDADMLSVRPMQSIFRLAKAGTIVACSNNTLYRYIKKDFELMQVDAPEDINVIHGSFSTVPMFINPTLQEAYLRAIWESPLGNDLDTPNLLAHSMNLYQDWFYLLNSYSWTNIHHSMVKPETFIRSTDNGYFSHQGEPVYMLHGHLHDPKYHEQLLEPMIKNYGYHEPYIDCTRNCIATMVNEYMKYYIPPAVA